MRSRPAAGLAGLLLVAALALAGCSGSDDSDATSGPSCTYSADGSSAAKDVDPPPSTPSRTGTVPVTIATGVGNLNARLDADAAPCTVNSFVSLAAQGFFNDTTCHRLTTSGIAVLQCGDPTATGSGGPGYAFDDELSGKEKYPAGTLAMANAGADTNGSQFFVVYGDTPLPAKYTVFGEIDASSLAIVEKVAEGGTDNAYGEGDGHPTIQVDIVTVTIGD